MARNTRYASAPEGASFTLSPATPKEMRLQEFARRLANLMQHHKPEPLTQSDLARLAGIGRDSVSNYINCKSLPEPKSAKKIADVFGVDVADLYPGAVERAVDSELPALEIKQVSGQPGRCWLRVNQMVSSGTAAQIFNLIETENAKSRGERVT